MVEKRAGRAGVIAIGAIVTILAVTGGAFVIAGANPLDAYYAYSVNHGETWMEFRLTPDSWDSSFDGLPGDAQFLGDYLGLGAAGNRAYPTYMDTSAGDTDVFTNVIEVPRPGDATYDGVIDVLDLIAVLNRWGPCVVPDGCDADLNGDGTIDVLDLLQVLQYWS